MNVTGFLEAFIPWAKIQSDVMGVALVGSYARNGATEKSDIDLIILTRDVAKYLQSQEWRSAFGKVEKSKVENWGRVETLRVFYENGFEVEYNFSTPEWAGVPVDSGTRRVVSDGMRILYDPKGILEILQKAVSMTAGHF
jgi:predicted nucleotidyltransferase